MALSILNNIPSLVAQNNLSITNQNLQKTLFRLSSGSRINSGADDAAGLAIADGLKANTTALTQSAQNASRRRRRSASCRRRARSGHHASQSRHYTGHGSIDRHSEPIAARRSGRGIHADQGGN